MDKFERGKKMKMKARKNADNQHRRYPLMPKPAVFKKKTDYDRKKEKMELRKRLITGD